MNAVPGARAQLEAIFHEALAAVDGATAVRRAVAGNAQRLVVAGRPLPEAARVVLFAAGKAASPMAAAFEACAGDAVVAGLVVTKLGYGAIPTRVRRVEAAHPVPDARCERAARDAFALLESARPDDVVCALLSGGASSLLACPVEGLVLEDLSATTRLLLEAGADIEETNTVRMQLGAAAGGRLARRCGARRIEVLALSDVPGDRVDLIGSGPFCADPRGPGAALEVLRRRGLLQGVPPAVRAHLEAGARGEREVTAKPGDPAFADVRTTLVGTNRDAVAAVREAARRRGLEVRVVSQPLAGEARDAGAWLVALARRVVPERPMLLVAGGETAVTVRGRGRGGRSQELALAAAVDLDGGPPITLLAAGTDGTDGPTDAAGAFADPATIARGAAAGVDASAALSDNDAHGFFSAEGGLFVTGPTGTNVMDLVLVRVDPPRA